MNVMFPSPRHSVTHSALIAAVGILIERMARMWSQLLWICLEDKGISEHENSVEMGYKRSGNKLWTIKNTMAAELRVILFVQKEHTDLTVSFVVLRKYYTTHLLFLL